jgi:predicted permease
MSSLLQDVRFAVRVLIKAPGFTAAAVLVLALGIGLNTATFSGIYALAFSPRPFPAPDQLVQLFTQDKRATASFRAFSHATYRELRERSDLFAGVLAQKLTLVAVGEGSEARRAFSALISANFFEVLGVPLAQGRSFTSAEESPGEDEPVVIVSHGYWRRSGFKSDLVGSTIRINGRPFTVAGITPEGFNGTMAMLGPDFYFPLGVFDSIAGTAGEGQRTSLAQRDVFALVLVARLQANVSSAAAGSALAGIAAGLEQLYPVEHRDKTITLGPLPLSFPDVAPANDGPVRLMGIILLGMTVTVLLIVSLNLAGLLLVRGHARRKEFAIRLALGGTRVRLVRQLLTEGLVLALVGGALGCLCAVWATDLVVAAVASHLPVELFPSIRTPAPVVVATLAFSTLATLFFALGPALKFSRGGVLLPDLQQNAGEDSVRRRRRWMPRHPLLVAQIALSLVLMIGGGLFARMVSGVIAADPGIDIDNTLVAEFDASLTGYDRARGLEIFRAVGERLAAVPGVHSVSIADSTPYSLAGDSRSVRRAGARPLDGARPVTADEGLAYEAPFSAVGADYFATLGVPLVRGRAFTRFETDHAGAPLVAIIDEALAKLLWPGEEALGRRLEWSGDESNAAKRNIETLEIVGIARTTHLRLKGEQQPPGAIYIPFAQGFTGNVYFFLRTVNAGEKMLTGLREAVRRELRNAAPDVAFSKVSTWTEHKDASLELWLLQRISTIVAAFGAFAAIIAVIGLYGVKAYGVSRRTREIGIRMALGAEASRVRSLILREGLASGLLGIALGLLLGAALGRLLHSVIGQIDDFDPVVFGIAALALFASVLVASWLPARRAMRVSPMIALRMD